MGRSMADVLHFCALFVVLLALKIIIFFTVYCLVKYKP
ncbi:hypothetical protein O59_002584 [Cellvibrio sp. BR]|nr:hypothetical protein O59_002584 [Cellvibrio sp. BR]